MTVRRNRHGRWMVDVQIERADGTIERVRKVAPVQTRRDAEAYEREVRRAVLEGTRQEVEDVEAPTIAAYVPQYLREMAAKGRKPSTVDSAERLLRRWIVDAVGRRRIDAIRTADFTAVRLAMVDAERSAKTINNALVVLGAMVRHWHAENDRTPPAFRVGMVKTPKDTRARFYTDDEAVRLVRAAAKAGPAELVLVLLGVDAGLRMSEIRALRWPDLALAGRAAVTVSRTREGDAEYAPKGWRSRTIPLTDRLVEALRALPRHLRDDHVLLDREGAPLTRRMVGRRFASVQRQAGVTHGSFHSTRHTFCTRLAAAGVPVRTIQELAGHADLATSQRYMHAAPGATDQAIAALQRHPGGTPSGEKTKTAS